jgi:RHS repeat-associated protein
MNKKEGRQIKNEISQYSDTFTNNDEFLSMYFKKSIFFAILVSLVIPVNTNAIEQVSADNSPTIETQSDSGDYSLVGTNQQLFSHESIGPKIEDSTGALKESVLLDIPQGRSGLSPDLRLEYNSQNLLNDNIAGYGWSLSIPFIERDNKTGTQDMYSSDYFRSSLGGDLASTAGGYYKHRIEDGRFIEYTLSGDIWSAYDKSGVKYTFGKSESARVATSGPARIYKWMLEEVRDTDDNFITYKYTKDAGQVYVSNISYTGNGVSEGVFDIDFEYETRADTVISYKPAFKIETNKRLDNIKASVNGSWVRKYDLTYTTGVNGVRSLLSGIGQTGRNSDLSEIIMPDTTFEYSSEKPIYTEHANPQIFGSAQSVADINGDGLLDVTTIYDTPYSEKKFKKISINNYPDFNVQTGEVGISSWASEVWGEDKGYFRPSENGVRIFDVNGDGSADIIQNKLSSVDHLYQTVYESRSGYFENDETGSWFRESFATSTSPLFSYVRQSDSGRLTYYTTGLLGNVNGDGLVDFVSSTEGFAADNASMSHLHAATSTPVWNVNTGSFDPIKKMRGNDSFRQVDQLIDINGDGLDDWMHGYNDTTKFCLNTGVGWDDSCDSPWNLDTSTRDKHDYDRGVRFVDMNGDGLKDYVRSFEMPEYINKTRGLDRIESGKYNYVYLNTGSGWELSGMKVPGIIMKGKLHRQSWIGQTYNNELVDWNGDGIPDDNDNTSYIEGTPKPDVLTKITYPKGGSSKFVHKYTTQLGVKNKIPYQLLVVVEKIIDDGNGNREMTTYDYEGGELYYDADNILDRKFASFKTVTETTPLKVVKTYFNQGNNVDIQEGERTDHFAQIGRVYRQDTFNHAGDKMISNFYSWNTDELNGGRYFVNLDSQMSQSFDGDADHRDTAGKFVYSENTGDLIQETNYGEVTGESNGTFSDIGQDSILKKYMYAVSTSSPISLVATEEILEHDGKIVRRTNQYYDNLSQGSVLKGKLTKQEDWITNEVYATTKRSYDSTYGLLVLVTDPQSKTTQYTYDQHNLYPSKVINALGQETRYTYDYSSGQVYTSTDPNNNTVTNAYDGIGRLVKTEVADPSNISNVTQAAWKYNDHQFPSNIHETRYLDSETLSSAHTYYDGFGRTIQSRSSLGDTYSVKDTVYNSNNLLEKESIPYFNDGSGFTQPTPVTNQLITYIHDSLGRVAKIENVKGSESHTYDQWAETVKDREGNSKTFTKDAYGNLTKVTEYLDGESLETHYTYDSNQNLTKITDSINNVRNFTYDPLSRLIESEDLHAEYDDTFGVWKYLHDRAGNVILQSDPNSQRIYRTYDSLHRVTSERLLTSSSGATQYVYDVCHNGKGKLCSVTTSESQTSFEYNSLGLVSKESVIIDGNTYTISYVYNWQGNLVEITYPDSSVTKYVYNAGGQLDQVLNKQPNQDNYAVIVKSLDYAANGAISKKVYGNGLETNYVYDSDQLNQLTNIVTTVEDLNRKDSETIQDTVLPKVSMVINRSSHLVIESSDPDIIEKLFDQDESAQQSSSSKDVVEKQEVEKNTEASEQVKVVEEKPVKKPLTLVEQRRADHIAWIKKARAEAKLRAEENQRRQDERIAQIKEQEKENKRIRDQEIQEQRAERELEIEAKNKALQEKRNQEQLEHVEKIAQSRKDHFEKIERMRAEQAEIVSTYEQRRAEYFRLKEEQKESLETSEQGQEGLNQNENTEEDVPEIEIEIETVVVEQEQNETVVEDTEQEGGDIEVVVEQEQNVSGGNGRVEESEVETEHENTATEEDDVLQNVSDGGAGLEESPVEAETAQGGARSVGYVDQALENSYIQNLSYVYDKVGNITTINDTSDTESQKRVNYLYDDLYRMTAAYTRSTDAEPYARGYTYNSIGNIKNITDKGKATNYIYSQSGYANPHAPTAVDGRILSYDKNGNLIKEDTDEYKWDYRNRLIGFDNGTKTHYGYNHTNDRILKKTSDTTTFTPNKYHTQKIDAQSTTTSSHIFFPDGGLIATVETESNASSTTSYIHQDHLGSTNVVTGENGNVSQTLDYYPFGAVRIDEGNNTTDRKYIGERLDDESDLSYLNARYYDSSRGQFISQDPVFVNLINDKRSKYVLLDPQLANSYSYSRNNPIGLKDDSGELIDIVADIALTTYSAYKLGEAVFTGGDVKSEAQNLALDAGGFLIPGFAGAGTIRRGLSNADEVGGAYKKIKGNITGYEAHHMPAKSSSPLNAREGPAILMEKADHMETASWGRSNKSSLYREQQSELISKGNFMKAQKMDIDNVRNLFGDKYNKAIKQMKDYTKTLDK